MDDVTWKLWKLQVKDGTPVEGEWQNFMVTVGKRGRHKRRHLYLSRNSVDGKLSSQKEIERLRERFPEIVDSVLDALKNEHNYGG